MDDQKRFVFEAVKLQMSQTKDGWALALRVHPDDLTMELMKLPVGQRVGVALIPIDDDDGAYRNKEMMARVQREEKQEAALKRKYYTLLDSIMGSPYFAIWAEERGETSMSRSDVEAMTGGPDWTTRYAALEAVAAEVRKLMSGD